MGTENRLAETAEEALHNLAGGHILDVATGSGGFISFLMDNLKEYDDITGIDSSERSLEAARKAHTFENIHFQRMDAAHVEFADSYFDTVCIANSLHHMENLPQVLSEMVRVCKPGGYIIISEMFCDNQSDVQLTHVYLHHWWAAVDTAEGIVHYETFTRQQLVDITQSLGLHDPRYFELNDLETDPKEPELISELDEIINRFIQRLDVIEASSKLRERGEQLRQRVHQVGFRGATSMLMLAQK